MDPNCFKIGDYVKLIKLSDDVFNGDHPNCINESHVVYGNIVHGPEVGTSLFLTNVSGDSYGFFHTSYIKSISETDNTFKTKNSTYKIVSLEKHQRIYLNLLKNYLKN